MLDVGATASYVMWTTLYPESLSKTAAKEKYLCYDLISRSTKSPISAEGGKIELISLGYTLQEPSTVAQQTKQDACYP